MQSSNTPDSITIKLDDSLYGKVIETYEWGDYTVEFFELGGWCLRVAPGVDPTPFMRRAVLCMRGFEGASDEAIRLWMEG